MSAFETATGSVDEVLLGLETGVLERLRDGDRMGRVEVAAREVTYVDPSLKKPIVGIEALRAHVERGA